MFAIVMLTALSRKGASRTATGDAREYRNQGTYTSNACESWGRRSSQETKTRQSGISYLPAQHNETGRDVTLASRHTHRHDHKRLDLAGMYPDPLPRHAHEPSVWAKTNRETNKRQHWHCSNEIWSTGTKPRATTQTQMEPPGIDKPIQTHANTAPHISLRMATQPQARTWTPTVITSPTTKAWRSRNQHNMGGKSKK